MDIVLWVVTASLVIAWVITLRDIVRMRRTPERWWEGDWNNVDH